MSRGDGCLWLMAARSIVGVQKDPSFQLNSAFGEHPLLDTGNSGPQCPGVEWTTFDFWLKECLSWSIPASGNILSQLRVTRKLIPLENLPSQCLASVPPIFSPKCYFQKQASCSFLNTHCTFSHLPAYLQNIIPDDLLWVCLRLCLPNSKPASHCQLPQLIRELSRTPNILTHFLKCCLSLTKYSAWS